MMNLQMRIKLMGTPITKKNSQRIRQRKGISYPAPSEAFEQYEKDCLWQIRRPDKPITEPVNVACAYYMPDRRIVDLTNLLEATDDILISAGVLKDDNSRIVCSHDGSRVRVDRENPRVEIKITSVYDEPREE